MRTPGQGGDMRAWMAGWLAAAAVMVGGCEDELSGMADSGQVDVGVDAARPDGGLADAGLLDASPDVGPVPDPLAIRVLTIGPEPVALDLLWIIDDSRSMCGEQSVLPSEIEAFTDRLIERLPSLDLAVAATTTDVERGRALDGRFVTPVAGPLPAPDCIDQASGLPLIPQTIDCEARAAAGRLAAVSTFGSATPDLREQGAGCADAECRRDALRFAMRCVTAGGLRGADFESGLEAVRQATGCGGPNGTLLGTCCGEGEACDAQFLRPGATRAIVVVADEDDCSPGPDFDPYTVDNCAWLARDLAPIGDYLDHLRGLATADAPVGFFVWGGPPAVGPSGGAARWRAFDPATDDPACDPDVDAGGDFDAWSARCCAVDDVCIGPPRFTCRVGVDGAKAMPRYRAVAAGLGSAFDASLCAPGGGVDLAERIADLAAPTAWFCLDAPSLDAITEISGRCLDGMPCDDEIWYPMPPDAIDVIDDVEGECPGLRVALRAPLATGAEVRVEHRAPWPVGESAPGGCALPAACAQVEPGVAVGLRVERAWRCAAPGAGCGSFCVSGLAHGDAAHCTVDCRGDDGCALGRCIAMDGPCADQPGRCFCGE